MLDPQLLRADLWNTANRLKTRGKDFQLELENFRRLETERKVCQSRTQQLQAWRNAKSKEIGIRKKGGEDVSALLSDVERVNAELQDAEVKLKRILEDQQSLLLTIPNVPHQSVPTGQSSEDNREERRVGTPRRSGFAPKDHVEIGNKLKLLDFDAATKIAGARFTLMTGSLARLHRNLCAVSRQRGQPARHGPTAKVRGRSFQGSEKEN